MSQAKVNQYKKEKANRKKIIAQQKRQHIAAVICGWAVVVAIAGWAGYSAYSAYERNQPVDTIYANIDALDDYLSSLDTEE